MTNLQVYNSIFEDCFEIKLIDVGYKVKYHSISAWDSIGHMSLISAIEETFAIEFDAEDIIEFNSYENGKKILLKYNIYIDEV